MLRRELLQALEAELRLSLPPSDVAARLAEAEAHLDDGTAGRVELGLSPAEAEREAVAAFGAAPRVTAPDRSRSVAVRLRWQAAAYGTLAAVYVRLDWLLERIPETATVMVAGVVACALGLAVAAFRARRAASVPILATGLAASVVFWGLFGACWLNLNVYGGTGYVIRWSAERLLQEDRGRLVGKAVAVSRANSWTPEERPELAQTVAAISQAQSDPLGNGLSQIGPGFGLGMGLAALAATVDLTAAGLGAAWAKRRRRRPTVA